MTTTRFPNGSQPDGCALAHVANEKAEQARDDMKTLYEAMGGIVRELAQLRAAMTEGFAQFGIRLRETQREVRSVSGAVEDLEDTKVRNLRKELLAAKGEATWLKRRLLGAVIVIVTAVIVAAVLTAIGLRK